MNVENIDGIRSLLATNYRYEVKYINTYKLYKQTLQKDG